MSFVEPPVFQRSPRLFRNAPKGEMEIPSPPAAPHAPSASVVSIILPGVLSLAFLVVTLSTMSSNAGMALVSLGFMGITSLTSLISYSSQKQNYQKAVVQREKFYRALLEDRRRELSAQREQQRALMQDADPDPEQCLARVEERDRRVWERSPEDADFLRLRLGLGDQPFGITVKPPREEVSPTPDPLLLEARRLADSFRTVSDTPITVPLGQTGVIGLAGPRASVLSSARSLAVQLAAHHSPDDVKLVVIYPEGEAAQWQCLRWLPHVWSEDRAARYLAKDETGAHQLLMKLYDLLSRREQRDPLARKEEIPLPRFVFLVGNPRLIEGEPILPLLLGSGQAIGALTIFLAERSEALPKGCRGVGELGQGNAHLMAFGGGLSTVDFQPDAVSPGDAERFARMMAPLRLRRMATATEIPASVTLFDLLGGGEVESLEAVARWRGAEPFRSLAVPLGRRAGEEPLILDLHERQHGPHGLVAGATGSGKSELLQSLVALLAVHFHPHELAFVLVDYKGGGMANIFADLPHLVGTITNLHGHLATRALAALKSELTRRETLLAQCQVNHVDAYQRLRREGRAKEPLPHLVIIVDEFAELKAEQPEFMRELVSAVRVGRSLGVHLILATQKPAGVVDEQIWANSRFRICLRVEREEDSKEVLKRPEAAGLARPGRAYLQVGSNEVFELFQAAWAGAPASSAEPVGQNPREIVSVALDGSRIRLTAPRRSLGLPAAATQLQAVVSHLRDLAAREGIERLPGPWLPALPEQVFLDEVVSLGGWDGQGWRPASGWLTPAVGLLDDPLRQRQAPVALDLGKDLHVAIYGAAGGGKTNLLQTLIVSLALGHSPQDVQLYLLDFGGRLLSLFAGLPHVGAVILGDEVERINRLMRLLLRELQDRKQRLAQAGVGNLIAYRNSTGDPLPAIVVVVDNYTSFANQYPEAEDILVQVIHDGGNLGLHLVFTASSPTLVRSKVSANVGCSIALHLTDRSEYSIAMGRNPGLEPAPVVGRGLVGDPALEFQSALPVRGATEVARTAMLRELCSAMERHWSGCRPHPVLVLPDVVALCDLLPLGERPSAGSDDGLAAPLGLDVDDLEPLTVDLADGPHFLISGPVQSGKTILLQSWLLALAERFPPSRVHMYLVDFRRTGLLPLARLPHVQAYLDQEDQLDDALSALEQVLDERRQALDHARREAAGMLDERGWLSEHPAIVLASDDYDALREGASATALEQLSQMARRYRSLGFHILLAGSCGDLTASWEGLVKTLKELQTGFLVGSSDHADLQLLNIRLSMGDAGKPLPPGQGFYSRRGRFRKIKAATPHAGRLGLHAIVDLLAKRAP